MSERLRCNLFIDVFAVVGAHHRDFARFGAGCCRSFALFVVVSRGRDCFNLHLTTDGTRITHHPIFGASRRRRHSTCREIMAAILKISAACALFRLAAVRRSSFLHIMRCKFRRNPLCFFISADGAAVRLFTGINTKCIGNVPFSPRMIGDRLHFRIFLAALCTCIRRMTKCDTC